MLYPPLVSDVAGSRLLAESCSTQTCLLLYVIHQTWNAKNTSNNTTMSPSNAVNWVGLGSMQAQQVPWRHVLQFTQVNNRVHNNLPSQHGEQHRAKLQATFGGYKHTSRSYKHDTETDSQSVLQLQAFGDKGRYRLQACCLTGNCHCLHQLPRHL